MEDFFKSYGIQIVVGMIVSVLAFLLIRILYFSFCKSKDQ